MPTYDGLDDDVVVNQVTEVTWSLTQVTAAVRAQLLKDARRVGDLSGKWAQKPLPKGVNRSTNPQRIF